MSIYQTLWYIAMYSVIGWCAEVAYHTVVCGNFENRGFLNGPVCPIYGFGASAVILCLRPFTGNMAVLFAASVVITSAIEWVTGFVLEKLFHTRWWDYTGVPFNIGGYVCLKFSLLWGVACTFVMRVLLPVTDSFINHIPRVAGIIILSVYYALLITDTVITSCETVKLNKRLSRMAETAERLHQLSDFMGEHISDGVSDAMEKGENLAYAIENKSNDSKEKYASKRLTASIGIAGSLSKMEKELGEKKDELERLVKKNSFVQRRLLKAFPDAKSTRNNEMLDKLRERLKTPRR